ncbi:hypothetical protein [Candidatus Halocynthiibacter alkanivorans]|uniref:hypothetical protein n=1 Tax=Candidatus Halocynthiibacter alkanivorans TaxID=2267619 RepID=UPI000DF49A46|nr:hypothetical protein [Candidatus Halocynthiibacter alkanivorans]
MLSKQIFLTAFGMIFTNFTTTLRITLPIFLVGVLVPYVFARMMWGNGDIVWNGTSGTVQDPGIFPILFVVLVMTVCFIAMIVLWHRHNLLPATQTRPRSFPPVSAVKRYILVSLGLGLVLGLLSVPAGFILFLALKLLSGITQLPPAFYLVLFVVLTTVVLSVVMRWSLILPAAAIGAPLTMGNAWRMSATASRSILFLAVAQGILYFLLEFVGGRIAEVIPGLATITSLIVLWFQMLFSAALLTALYAHLIQNTEETPVPATRPYLGPQS